MYFVNCSKKLHSNLTNCLHLDRTGIELSIGVNNKATEEYTNKRYLLTHYVINNRSFVKWLRKWETAHLRICISKTLFKVVDIIALL